MSRENVDVARRAQEAFNAGEFETATAEMAEDIEWRPVGSMTHGEVIVGTDAVRRFWSEWLETFEGFRLIVEDIFEAPVGAVAVTRASGRGVASGMELTGGSFFQVFEIRDKVRRLQMHRNREDALEAAGLTPWGSGAGGSAGSDDGGSR
jgi:ketosteroid isomerase-like protein